MPPAIAVSGIAAQAFRLMEMSPISSFGDDSEQGLAAAAQYPVALDICLADCDWSFASMVASLPKVDEPSLDPDLPHVYQRPSGLVAIRDIHPRETEWRLDADRLRADHGGPIVIRYTGRLTDETRLPGDFQTAVAYRLASLLAPRWTTSINRAEALRQAGDEYLERARRADRRSASPRRHDGRPRQCDWDMAAIHGTGGSYRA